MTKGKKEINFIHCDYYKANNEMSLMHSEYDKLMFGSLLP